jgi:hypothetical protein
MKHNIDFIEINKDSKIAHRYNIPTISRFCYVWEKLQCFKYTEKYDQICFLDADVLIDPKSDNIFNYCPLGKFSGCIAGERLDETISRIWGIQREIGSNELNLSTFKFLNAGLMVFDESLKESLTKDIDIIGKFFTELPEQDFLNYNINRLNIPINILDQKWNYLLHSSFWNRRKKSIGERNFVHFLGEDKMNSIQKYLRFEKTS